MCAVKTDKTSLVLVDDGGEITLYLVHGNIDPRSRKYSAVPLQVESKMLSDIIVEEDGILLLADFLPEFDPHKDMFGDPTPIPAPKEWRSNMNDLRLVARTLVHPTKAVVYFDRIGEATMKASHEAYAEDMKVKHGVTSQEAYERTEELHKVRQGLERAAKDKDEQENQDSMLDAMENYMSGEEE